MKKIFLTLVILVLFATLVACGDEATITTDGVIDTTNTPIITTLPTETTTVETTPMTTAIETTVADTTTGVTTTLANLPLTSAPDTEPIELEPTSVSYGMFLSGYFYTRFDDADRTSVRFVYDRDKMQKTGREYRYTYSEDGKLATYTIVSSDETLVYTLVYEADGKTALATSPEDFENVYRFTFDENGKIASEETLSGSEVTYRLDFDENGYIVMETMYFRGMAIEYETFYDDGIAVITCDLPNAATELTVTYNEAGYPISLEGQQLTNEYWNKYTYNNKMLCVTANFMDGNYEYFYTFTYDDQDRMSGYVMESDDGIYEVSYDYDENGYKIRFEEKSFEHSGILSYAYVSVYEYDDKGRRVKTISYEDGDEETYVTKWTYTYTYNEADLLVLETATFTTSDDGFIADFKEFYEYDKAGRLTSYAMVEYNENGAMIYKNATEYEYDENGKLTKEIYSRYNASGELVSQEVTDHTK